MQRWMVYALLSAGFAGLTAVIAKQGLVGISAELGLTVRTIYVCFFILIFAWVFLPASELNALQKTNIVWLGLSGLATAGSWVFYYKALKVGDVATVALIDKTSVVIAILLAWIFLKEAITLRILLGMTLIIAGLVIVSKK
jgi:bacterial/archaeal transporter family protein